MAKRRIERQARSALNLLISVCDGVVSTHIALPNALTTSSPAARKVFGSATTIGVAVPNSRANTDGVFDRAPGSAVSTCVSPTPASVSWFDFRFHEREDGHLVVSVAERQVFRAHASEGSRGRRQAEVAKRDGVVGRIYSFEELALRTGAGRLTPEAGALTALLRGAGKLVRKPDDMAVLKLGRWLSQWTGLDGAPLQYSDASRSWTASFECSSDIQTA